MKKMIQLLTIISTMILGINGVKAAEIDDKGTYTGNCNQISNCNYQCEVTDGGSHFLKFNYAVIDKNEKEIEHKVSFIDSDGDCSFFGSETKCDTNSFHITLDENPYFEGYISSTCPAVIPKVNIKIEKIVDLKNSTHDHIVSKTINHNYVSIYIDSNVSPDNDRTSCGFLGNETSKVVLFLQKIFKYIKIIIPVLIVVLSIADFIKVIGTGKDDDMKKAINRFVKRIIIAIAFVLIPFLISLIINISGVTSEYSGINDGLKAVFCILG